MSLSLTQRLISAVPDQSSGQQPTKPPMKNLLRTLFGSQTAQPSFKRSGAPSTLQTDSEAINRQQLVMITVRDVMRVSGIPPDWIDCHTLNVTSRRRGTGLYIHLVINHWDERLMRVTSAFQDEIKTRMERFDPKAAVWVHGIAWQLDMAGSCPHTRLPDKSYWETPAPAAAAANASQVPTAHFPAVLASSPAADPKNFVAAVNFEATQPYNSAKDLAQDLEKLFAIRDEEIKQTQAKSPAPIGGFEPTQPSPLNR